MPKLSSWHGYDCALQTQFLVYTNQESARYSSTDVSLSHVPHPRHSFALFASSRRKLLPCIHASARAGKHSQPSPRRHRQKLAIQVYWGVVSFPGTTPASPKEKCRYNLDERASAIGAQIAPGQSSA